MCCFVLRNGEMRHIPLSRSNFMPADITFRALFTDTRARLCLAVALCFFYSFFLACGSAGLLFAHDAAGLLLQREAARHVPGLCGQWFGSRPASQMAGVSVSLSFSGDGVQFCPRASPPFSSASPPPPPPFADEYISPCKQSRGKNMSLCPRGMRKTGVNMPLKRC